MERHPDSRSGTVRNRCLLLALAYAAMSAALFICQHGETLLIVLLGLGGLGLGIQFSALIVHLTTVVPADFASDISGVSTATLQIGAAIGVAAIGTLYLGLDAPATTGHATHAFRPDHRSLHGNRAARHCRRPSGNQSTTHYRQARSAPTAIGHPRTAAGLAVPMPRVFGAGPGLG
jgi:hypothetical protein